MKSEVKKQMMDFLSLPFTKIMEIPLTLLAILESLAGRLFTWITDNSFIDWMNDLREDKPLVFWLSGIIWIPILLIVGLYLFNLFLSICLIAVLSVIALSILFAILCKIIYVILLITER